MATKANVPKAPSKTIEEFLHRHPQVRTGTAAKAELDHLHEHGDTFCVINKLYDNAILHKDYDPDSLKLIFAFAYVNDEQAMANYAEDAGEDDSVLCDCEVGREEGPDHHLHEFVRATEPDCEVHKGEELDPGYKIQVNYTVSPSKKPATWPSPAKKPVTWPSFIDIPKVDVINADSGIRLFHAKTSTIQFYK
ncbi:hypothetical protein QSH57_005251 [Fusarium oxysporum f. sp. vasinfectum]|nr:hypothetical protein QSH57_005251 [Fusarium oxysporum f. sp. vasinfectum]